MNILKKIFPRVPNDLFPWSKVIFGPLSPWVKPPKEEEERKKKEEEKNKEKSGEESDSRRKKRKKKRKKRKDDRKSGKSGTDTEITSDSDVTKIEVKPSETPELPQISEVQHESVSEPVQQPI